MGNGKSRMAGWKLEGRRMTTSRIEPWESWGRRMKGWVLEVWESVVLFSHREACTFHSSAMSC